MQTCESLSLTGRCQNDILTSFYTVLFFIVELLSLNDDQLRIYTAFLDTRLPWSHKSSEVEIAFKLALLRLPKITMPDSQAIDNKAFQILLQDNSFVKTINKTTDAGPTVEVSFRSNINSFVDVLKILLDVEHKKDKPYILSGLTEVTHLQLEEEHKQGILSLSRFQDIAPEYYRHVKSLSNKLYHHYSEKDNLLMPFYDVVHKTLNEIPQTVGERDLLLRILRKRWDKKFKDNTRADFISDINKLKTENKIDEEQYRYIDNRILTFSYQRQFSSIANGKLVAGNEIKNWISNEGETKTNVIYKIPVTVPKNQYLTELKWEGIEMIRDRKEFIDSLIQLRVTARSPVKSEYKEAVSNYIKQLLDGYSYAADKKLAPNPARLQETMIVIFDTISTIMGFLGTSVFEKNGISIGGTIVDAVENASKPLITSFIMSRDLFVPKQFNQMIMDLNPISEID